MSNFWLSLDFEVNVETNEFMVSVDKISSNPMTFSILSGMLVSIRSSVFSPRVGK